MKYKKVEKVFGGIFEYFHFAIYIRILIEAYAFTCIVVFDEIYRTDAAEDNEASYNFSVFILIFSIFSIISIFLYYNLKWKKNPSKYTKELFDSFKDKSSCRLFYVFYLMQKL